MFANSLAVFGKDHLIQSELGTHSGVQQHWEWNGRWGRPTPSSYSRDLKSYLSLCAASAVPSGSSPRAANLERTAG